MFSKKETEHYDYPQLCVYQDKHNNDEFESYIRSEDRPYDGETSIYIHIPFCKSICVFCNYYKVLWSRNSSEQIDAFVDAIVGEIRYYGSMLPERLKRISGIQFGGGTPTILPEPQMHKIMQALAEEFDLSACSLISIEGTMDSLIIEDFACVSRLVRLGFNRISFGVQTFTPELRRKYGLQGDITKFEELCNEFHLQGLHDYNIDLMYNYAEQEPDEVIQNIEKAFKHGVTSIDLYSLNVYPDTKLYSRYKKSNLWGQYLDPVKEGTYREIYAFLKSQDDINLIMGNTISKRRSWPHNTLAIQLGNNRDYGGSTIGIGPSSRGTIDSYVYKNVADMAAYVSNVEQFGHGIRTSQAVSNEEMENRTLVMFPNFMGLNKAHAQGLERHRDKVDQLLAHGYLVETPERLTIPKEHGFWVGNMSALFYSKAQTKKMTRSYFLTRRARQNLYNQDEMQIPLKVRRKEESVTEGGLENV
jgi:oxygen-independent coproporphyrinogen-3 oxidase